ncbi:MAG: hypothetical protein HYU41_16055 [Candidatus Rokubacteria bacterium]|nr:hypothetical protein [Candidatus Rokubacteria bacterium]
MTSDLVDDRFRTAARAYFVYGVVYWLGGVWLAFQGIGVRAGSAVAWRGVIWIIVGLVLVLLVPFLLRRRRPGFERWVLSRRDFARVVSVLMAFRAFEVARIALRPDGPSVPAPWGGAVTFQAGAAVFFVVTVAALVFVARAAWTDDEP